MAAPAAIAAGEDHLLERPVRSGRIPRWVGVVFPAAVLGGAALAVMHAVNQSWLDIVVLIGGAAALGLVTGFIARRSLKGRSRLVRWIVALGALIVGFCVAGLVSGGRIGLRPLLLPLQTFRWSEIAQLAVGGVAAWLAVRAFSSPRVPAPAEPVPDPGPPAWGFTYHPTVTETQPIRARRGSRARGMPESALRPATVRVQTSAPFGAVRRRLHRLRAGLARAAAWRPALGLRPARPGKAPIRFTGAAEDRCPYCLDIVAEHDPRGVTTCPICHTRHHAECWAVTGTCQMPHLYEGSPSARTGAAR
jgi:hypothetical protein